MFTLFVGFGLGSLLFGAMLSSLGFSTVLGIFRAGALVAAALAVPAFSGELPRSGPQQTQLLPKERT